MITSEIDRLFEKAELLRQKSKYPLALLSYKQTLKKSLSEKNHDSAVACLLSIGDVNRMVGDFEQAEKAYARALTEAKKIRNEEAVADAKAGMGLSRRGRGVWKYALTMLNQALKFYRKQRDMEGIAFTLWSLAGSLRIKGDIPGAVKTSKEAFKAFQSLRSHSGVGYCLCGLSGSSRIAEATGIDQLLEMILLQAEVMELRANPQKLARGHVVEAKIDSGRGPVATVLVSEGTLRNGDAVVCGVHYGKIRAMLDDLGQAVDSAGPSVPVEILGLSGVPMAGDEYVAVVDEKAARQISLHRTQKQRTRDVAQTSRPSLESLFERMKQGELKELNLILKADVHGSIEALSDALTKLSNEEVNVNVVHAATGAITESDACALLREKTVYIPDILDGDRVPMDSNSPVRGPACG